MRWRPLLGSMLVGSLVLVPWTGAGAIELLPIDEVRPGMVGVGRTVFEGTRIEEFTVRILGVLRNAQPRQDVILARLEGGPLAETGVIAGMSGSPVYVNDRLVGAVAYGFPFSKATVAGITPIGEMIESTQVEAPRATAARFHWRGALAAAPERVAAVFASALRGTPPGLPPFIWPVPEGSAATPLSALPLPLTLAGLASDTFGWVREALGGSSLAPLLVGGSGPLPESLPGLAPGSAVALSLIEGDIDVSATGTVTDIEEGRVLAFGHPFYNLGPTRFPMRKAFIHSVLPNLQQSWKMASVADVVGVFEQDRATAVAGRLGAAPRMIPLEIDLSTSRGHERHYSMHVVEDELLTPVLTYVALLSTLQANERTFGAATFRLDARVTLRDRPEIRVQDLAAGTQPAQDAAALVAVPVAALLGNDLQPVAIDKVSVRVLSEEASQRATLERAWLDEAGPLRPGGASTLRLQLRTHRGQRTIRNVSLSLPPYLSPGQYLLAVLDGQSMAQLDERQLGHGFEPRTVDQLLRALNGLRRNNRIYVRLLRSDEGAVVSGEYMPSLPPSVLAVLQTSPQASDVTALRTASFLDLDVPTEFSVQGACYLPLTVQRW